MSKVESKMLLMGEVVRETERRDVGELVMAGFWGMDVVGEYWNPEKRRVEIPKGFLDSLGNSDNDSLYNKLRGFVGAGELAGLIGGLTPEQAARWQEDASVALAREIFAIDDKTKRNELRGDFEQAVEGITDDEERGRMLAAGALDFLAERFRVDVDEISEGDGGREIIQRLIQVGDDKYRERLREFGFIDEDGKLTELGSRGVELFLERKGLRPMLERSLQREQWVFNISLETLVLDVGLFISALQSRTLLNATLAFNHVRASREMAMGLGTMEELVVVALLGGVFWLNHLSVRRRERLKELLETV